MIPPPQYMTFLLCSAFSCHSGCSLRANRLLELGGV
jgi:hypothetical protein